MPRQPAPSTARGKISSLTSRWPRFTSQAASDDYSTAVPITPAVVASEQQVADAFTKAGLIPVHVDFSQFVDTSFNTTVGAS